MNSIESALAVLDDAVQKFAPSWVFALFSGGHDSLTSSYVASLHPKFNGCVHINTGIGIPATRQFVIDTCAERGWRLLEYKASENTNANGAPNPKNYDEIVTNYGFPGPYGHSTMYFFLKKSQIRKLCREHIGRVLLVSGQRQQESVRRMRNIKGSFDIHEKIGWCRPIYDWSKLECSDLLTTQGFKRNEIALRFGRSGECLCGAFAKPGELAALKFACPESYSRIRKLEERVRAAGFPWGWEEQAPRWWVQERKDARSGQMKLFEEQLCTSCKWRAL